MIPWLARMKILSLRVPIAPSMNPTAQKLVITSPQKTLPKPPKSIIKEIIPNSIESEYAGYLKLKKSLSALIDEENIAGTKTIIRPKTLPQTGKSILSRVKKLVNGREIDVNKYPKTGVVTYP